MLTLGNNILSGRAGPVVQSSVSVTGRGGIGTGPPSHALLPVLLYVSHGFVEFAASSFLLLKALSLGDFISESLVAPLTPPAFYSPALFTG